MRMRYHLFLFPNLLKGACVVLTVIAIGLTGACASLDGWDAVTREKKSYDADFLTLKRAERALKAGNYEKALEIYRMLSQLARREKIRRQALYGLACTRLITADTPKEMETSITLWEAWSQLLPETLTREDPRLLTTVLEQKRKLIIESARNKSTQKTMTDNAGRDDALSREKDQEINKLKSRVNSLEQEIQILEHQLESLEAIDQKMQEKKKEFTSP